MIAAWARVFPPGPFVGVHETIWWALGTHGVEGLLVLASFLTSALTAAFGLGGGVLMLAAMGLALPSSALIPVHAAVQLGSNAGRAGLMLGQVAWGDCGPFLLGSLFGIALLAPLVAWLPAALVEIAVAGLILWSVFLGRASAPGGGALAGLLTGALTTVVGATGPFVMAWVRRRERDRETTVATHAVLMGAQHGVKVGAFAALGFAYAPWGPLIALMVLAGLLGTLLGRRLLRAREEAGFRRVVDILLVLAAARLLWSGVGGLV